MFCTFCAIKKDFQMKVFFMDCTCRKSNFLKYIKELIEELKRSETVLFLEHYNFFKQAYITLKNNSCHSELV